MTHSDVSVANLHKLIKKLPEYPEISVLHLPRKVLAAAGVSETLEVLSTVDDVLDMLPSLSVLGIHGLRLRAEHVPALISIFRVLRCKLIGLSLSLKSWKFGGSNGERVLLEAIGKFSKLELLVFPDWEKFVGDRTDLVKCLATARECTIFVRDEPSQGHLAAVAAVAPNLNILSAPF
jgi:hypothetical protein